MIFLGRPGRNLRQGRKFSRILGRERQGRGLECGRGRSRTSNFKKYLDVLRRPAPVYKFCVKPFQLQYFEPLSYD